MGSFYGVRSFLAPNTVAKHKAQQFLSRALVFGWILRLDTYRSVIVYTSTVYTVLNAFENGMCINL